jgi:hypothetical protein
VVRVSLRSVLSRLREADLRLRVEGGRLVRVSGYVVVDESSLPLALLLARANGLHANVEYCRNGWCKILLRGGAP